MNEEIVSMKTCGRNTSGDPGHTALTPTIGLTRALAHHGQRVRGNSQSRTVEGARGTDQ